MLGGYNPERKDYMQEITVEDELPEFEFDATLATAEAFKLEHGDKLSSSKRTSLTHFEFR